VPSLFLSQISHSGRSSFSLIANLNRILENARLNETSHPIPRRNHRPSVQPR
jgi:hypothetical protein